MNAITDYNRERGFFYFLNKYFPKLERIAGAVAPILPERNKLGVTGFPRWYWTNGYYRFEPGDLLKLRVRTFQYGINIQIPATFKYNFIFPNSVFNVGKIGNLMANIGFAFYRLFSSFRYFFFYFKY